MDRAQPRQGNEFFLEQRNQGTKLRGRSADLLESENRQQLQGILRGFRQRDGASQAQAKNRVGKAGFGGQARHAQRPVPRLSPELPHSVAYASKKFFFREPDR